MRVRKQPFLVLMGILSGTLLWAQQGTEGKDEAWKKNYRATATKFNDLVDTRLDVKFDYDKSYMYGKAWVTLKPTSTLPIPCPWTPKEWISTRWPL